MVYRDDYGVENEFAGVWKMEIDFANTNRAGLISLLYGQTMVGAD